MISGKLLVAAFVLPFSDGPFADIGENAFRRRPRATRRPRQRSRLTTTNPRVVRRRSPRTCPPSRRYPTVLPPVVMPACGVGTLRSGISAHRKRSAAEPANKCRLTRADAQLQHPRPRRFFPSRGRRSDDAEFTQIRLIAGRAEVLPGFILVRVRILELAGTHVASLLLALVEHPQFRIILTFFRAHARNCSKLDSAGLTYNFERNE